MTIVKEQTIADILRYFLLLESKKQRFQSEKETILGWRELPDDQLKLRMSQWINERGIGDTNPVLVWTVGERAKQVARWTLREMPINGLYTSGLNPIMKDDLDCVGGNIVNFCRQSASKYTEFALEEFPSEVATLIAVLREKNFRKGRAELLDGAHRAISMIRRGESTAHFMVAELA